MACLSLWFYHVLISVFILTRNSCCDAGTDDRQVYIVYMGAVPEGEYAPTALHTNLLQDVLEASSVSDALVRSYKRSFSGFAAKLTVAERNKLANRKEVVSIFPSRTLQTQTTRSWDFIGFPIGGVIHAPDESDLIIGVLDTGIWIDSESFNSAGYPPPPPYKWKGVCAGGKNFTCNNKIIGARFYGKDASAHDSIGHGTHIASTAAGNIVPDASFYGIAKGIARGGVSYARIAVYKVCTTYGCEEADILAGFDDAISDGVDIITISIGPDQPRELYEDSIAIGSFHAMVKNILTLQSAGNSGPNSATVGSNAPWLFTVAASNTDQHIVDKIVLGDGKEIVGNGINSFKLNGTSLPIVFGKNASSTCSDLAAEFCEVSCLDAKLVEGKIVLCTDPSGIYEALSAGALGAIVPSLEDYSTIVSLPASSISKQDLETVISYVNSTISPRANILTSKRKTAKFAPQVASFSSRGPNAIIPDILKPDISAPGVEILAAFSPIAPISTSFPDDTRHVKYSILSGTSMACPHVAGAAAYVKSAYSDWSPSVIKSALMTTAWPMNTTEQSDYEFAYGAGLINPVEAITPGLVYEIVKDDYIKLLCSIGFNQTSLQLITGDTTSACTDNGTSSPIDLNYPSMTASLKTTAKSFEVKFRRTVTNFGTESSVYSSKVVSNDPTVKINVVPSVLSFPAVGDKREFVVTVSGTNGLKSMLSASLVWNDGVHNVRSPIVLFTK